ncbi:hypothetical protein TNCV_356821 [Trichonephila clavipes]|nr:hypothetical protein TNCV_356821 [Trichonephila clavipes]
MIFEKSGSLVVSTCDQTESRLSSEDVQYRSAIPLSICSILIDGRGSRVVKVSDCGWPCHEFKPSTTKDPLCRGEMHIKSVESSNVLPLVWQLGEGGVPVQVPSTSLDHSSELRGPSPKVFV